MFCEECAQCGKNLDDNTPCRGTAHTDVFYCDECFHSDQPERLNPENHIPEVMNMVCESLTS